MTDKTRKLLLTLELLALAVSAILILIDYRLKKDVLQLFMKVERRIDQANGVPAADRDIPPDSVPVYPSDLVADNARMETANGHAAPGAAGGTQGPGARATGSKRSRGTGRADVPNPDKPVGS